MTTTQHEPRFQADHCDAGPPFRRSDQPIAVVDTTTGVHVSHHASRKAAEKAAATRNQQEGATA